MRGRHSAPHSRISAQSSPRTVFFRRSFLSRWLTADRIVGIVLLAVSIFFMLQALQLVNDIAPIFRDQPMRLDTMPKIIGLVAIIASLVTIFMPSTATRAVKDPQLQAAQAQQKRASVLPISATTRLASLRRWLRSCRSMLWRSDPLALFPQPPPSSFWPVFCWASGAGGPCCWWQR